MRSLVPMLGYPVLQEPVITAYWNIQQIKKKQYKSHLTISTQKLNCTTTM